MHGAVCDCFLKNQTPDINLLHVHHMDFYVETCVGRLRTYVGQIENIIILRRSSKRLPEIESHCRNIEKRVHKVIQDLANPILRNN